MNQRITSLACAFMLALMPSTRAAFAQEAVAEDSAAVASTAAEESAPKKTSAEKPSKVSKDKSQADKTDKKAATKDKKSVEEPKDDLESRQDVIKSVQRRPVLKKHRLELTALGAMTINDPLYLTFAFQGSAHFFLAESLSIGVGVAYFIGTATLSGVADVRRSEHAVPSIFERPNMAGTIEMTFNPFYGKTSFHNAAIGHVDTYLIGGFGGVFNFHKTGRPAGEIGIGQRFNLLSWLNIKWELRDYIFTDTVESDYGTNSDIQNYLMLNIGVGFFVPPTFNYKVR